MCSLDGRIDTSVVPFEEQFDWEHINRKWEYQQALMECMEPLEEDWEDSEPEYSLNVPIDDYTACPNCGSTIECMCTFEDYDAMDPQIDKEQEA